MKKFLAALAASGMLVAGGFAAAAISTPTAASAQESTEEAPATTDDGTLERPDKGAILDEVFDSLIADGVITQDQADQIREALDAKREELREQFGDQRRSRGFRGGGVGFGDLLEDGVIDAAELAELPDGHPLADPDGPLAEYLDDGQLTIEELEEHRAEFGGERQGRGGFRGFGGAAPSEDASA